MRGSGSLKDKAFELLSCSLLITCHPEPCFGEGPPAMCRTTLPSSRFLARKSRFLVKKPDSKQLSPKYRGRSFAKTGLRMTVLRKFAAVKQSVLYYPHQPTRCDGSCSEKREAFSSVEDHVAWRCALGDAKDDGCEEGEDNRCAEVGELHGYSFFPIAMS